MEGIGISAGLLAALCQSLSYVFSRQFVVGRQGGVLRLLVLSHVIMGAGSLLLLPFVWAPELLQWRAYAGPVCAAAGFYLIGQIALLCMMRDTDSSRVAPLLGIKIAILAFISVTFLGQPLTVLQWGAVALSVCAALMLNFWGGSLSWRALSWLGIACTAYSLSDLGIAALVQALAPLPTLHASAAGVCLTYLFCGVAGVGLLPVSGGVGGVADWKGALPYAFFWFASMVFLYACFGLVGAVYGNVLQATRGIISIMIGALVARWGMLHLEHRISRGMLVRRIAAAALMCAAIWLFRA